MRTLADIDFELDAVGREFAQVSAMLDRLRDERSARIRARDADMVVLFDQGKTIRDIAFLYNMPSGTVNCILWRKGRKVFARQKPVSHWPAEQQRVYKKARACGIGPKAARQMAQAVPAPT